MTTIPLPSPLLSAAPSPKTGVLSTSSASGKAGHGPHAHDAAGSALGFLAELAAAIGAVGPVATPAPPQLPGPGAGTSAAPALRPSDAVTSTVIASASTRAPDLTAAGTPLPQATLTTAVPVEVAAAKPHPRPPAPQHTTLTTDSAAAGIDPLSAAAASPPVTPTTDDGTGQTTAVLRQVFPEVTRVATTPGTHRLAITLHPDELGEVRVTVVVRGDNVRVNVATDPTSGTARTALQHGAPELRQLLESTGANAHVEFRELAATGAGLGSATDGGGRQQQPQAFAQAQSHTHSQAQPHTQNDGQHHRQSRTHPDPASPHRSTVTTATATQPGTQLPTARTATAGLDRLI